MSSSSGHPQFSESSSVLPQSGFGNSHDADIFSQPTLPRRSQSDRVTHFPSSHLSRHDRDLPPIPQPDLSPEARRASLIAMDRKRRFTGLSHETGRRRTTTGGFTNRDNRYHPNSPRRSSHRSSLEDAQSSAPREVIDLTSSSPTQPEPVRPELSRAQRTSSNCSRGYVVPRWQPDADVSECPICHRQFGWLFRKHHCRKCGRVVCNDCSPHRITIPRQYIVHPPGFEDMVDIPRIDLTRDFAHDDDTGLPSPYRRRGSALGGGEKVRLCNPCVPDPQPELQAVLREGLPRLPMPPPPEPLRPAPAGISSFAQMHALASRQAVQERRYMDHLPQLPHPGTRVRAFDEDDDSGSSPEAYTSTPRRHVMGISARHQPIHSRFHSLDSRQAPLPSLPPFAAHSHQRSIDFARAHNIPLPPGFEDALLSGRLGQPSSSAQPITHMPPRRRIKEEDMCPICRHELPPKGLNGDETDRENHIMECISQHDSSAAPPQASLPTQTSSSAPMRTQQFGASGPTSPVHSPPRPVSPPSARPPQFFRFTATEKDCGPAEGTDGEAQECSICMVEYDVGDKLVRLECWCKFHEDCIVSWFGRRAECPVHKLS